MKQQRIGLVSLVVADYDQAIDFYTQKLGFELLEDSPREENKRWVRVAPQGAGGCELLLAQAANEEQRSRIGNQTGGRVFLFLETDDFARDYAAMQQAGVGFTEQPRREPYGKVVVFSDPYGNLWDLIEYD